MKILLLDWFNIIKRYMYQQSLEELEYGDLIDTVTFMVLNKLCDVYKEVNPDLLVICSDSGYNRRAQSVVSGYKANRNRAKSLSKEEKETSYTEFIKNVAKTLPCPFLEVRNTEADMIIRCVINFFNRIDTAPQFTIASSDSDFIQLLGDNVKIYDWYKGSVDTTNWFVKHKHHDGCYLNTKNYALAKSIVGDKSDNVIGMNSWGWKKTTRIFDNINAYFKTDMVVENFNQLENYIATILDTPNDTDKKEIAILKKFSLVLKENMQHLITNMSIIDLDSIETPYIYEINEEIKRQFFSNPMVFDKKQLLEYMQLGRYGSDDPYQYKKLIEKNSKSMYMFYNWAGRANNSLACLSTKI